MRILLIVALVAISAATAHAEQWSARAKIASGRCPDGATVTVTEDAISMALHFTSGGEKFTEVKVDLAPDGSGKTMFPGAFDPQTSLEIPAGKGKRQLKTAQTTKGNCQWVWN